MAGIAGIVITENTRPMACNIDLMMKALQHRGQGSRLFMRYFQDDMWVGSEWKNGPTEVALAQCSQECIAENDLLGGKGYCSYYVVCDGDIYNQRELSAELQGRGHRILPASLSNMLAAAYAEWGTEYVTRLEGSFAIAQLDRTSRKMLLVRDPFGIKPLYYTVVPYGLVFASEVKALLRVQEVAQTVDPQRLYMYLRFGHTDFGEGTLIRGIQQVPSAHCIEISLDRPHVLTKKQYWKINLDNRQEISFVEATGKMRDLFLKNVDVVSKNASSIGAALSGGIDSSSIVIALRYLKGTDFTINTFSYVADDASISEEVYADSVASAAGTVVHKIKIKPEELVRDIGKLIYYQDEPFGSTSVYAQYRVQKLAHESGVKIILDGQGADELLGGYKRFLSAYFISLLRKGYLHDATGLLLGTLRVQGISPAYLLAQAAAYVLPEYAQTALRSIVGKEIVPSWMNKKWLEERNVGFTLPYKTQSKVSIIEAMHDSLVLTSLPHLLRHEDRNSAELGLQCRLPFLTKEFAEFALSLPEEHLISRDGTTKHVFREAMKGLLPEKVLNRRDKIGFKTPESKWLGANEQILKNVLNKEILASIPILNSNMLKEDYGQRLFNEAEGTYMWRILNLIEWSRIFKVDFD